MTEPFTVRIGTRGSALARWQAEWVSAELAKHEVASELVLIQTQGDVKSGPIGAIGSQGVFTKEIQRALLDERVDVAVHSLKDLPTEAVPGLQLAATPPRENCGDALISAKHESLEALPEGSRLGTGSARRKAQLLNWRRDLEVLDIRGNVETRLQKAMDGEYDAIILAEAGLRRLGLHEHIRETVPRRIMLPAVGQGALGLEIREGDERMQQTLGPLQDPNTLAAVLAERSLLASLRGGCLAPVGAWGRVEGEQLALDAVVLDAEGNERLDASGTASPEAATELGAELAEQLREQGAERLIAGSRRA